MDFDKDNKIKKAGKYVGFIGSYIIFTFILFLILRFTHKLPQSNELLLTINITLFIMLFGTLLKMYLK